MSGRKTPWPRIVREPGSGRNTAGVRPDSQSAHAPFLFVDALPADTTRAFDRLVQLLLRRGRLQAGYPGTYAVMDVLVDGGGADLAYRLLSATGPDLHRECPLADWNALSTGV